MPPGEPFEGDFLMRAIGLILGLGLTASMAAAGDPVIKDLSAADFEKIITDTLGKEFAKQQNGAGFLYDIKQTPYFAQYNSQKKFVLFYARMKNPGVPLEKINAWNRDAVYSRAYIAGNAVIFEVPLGYSGGITAALVANYYRNLEAEFKGFVDALK
jgi:putative sensory transduction regulator